MMQRARFLRTLGLALVLDLVGFGGGCGPGPRDPAEQEKADETVREARKSAHEQLDANIKKAPQDPGGRQSRKAAHSGR